MSCEIDYAGFEQNKPTTENVAIVPTELWITDALEQINSLDKTPASYTVFKDFGKQFGTSKLYFYNRNSLGKASFLSDSINVDEMYFENGKLIFSLHKHLATSTPYIVAYANKKPYAAAIKEQNGNWVATNPKKLELDMDFVNEASALAVHAETKEKNPDFVYRICELRDTINRELTPSLNEYFVMNVVQGDPIKLNLESDSEDVFFTIGPKDGVNMERRNWKGDASETGDLLITVFSTTSKTKGYTLIAERLIDESQLSLQSIRQNR